MGKYGKTITDAYQEVLEWTVTAHELQEKKKVTKREIKDLENDNEHGMVALKLAQSFGTPKEVKKIQDINKRHQRSGEIESKDQKERDAIARKYYNMAEVYEIGTKEYADHTKNMTPGQTVDEGKMKDIVTDVKSALGKIRHRVSQKGSKFIVSVDSNDEEDAQKAMKNHPLYVAGKLRVIPEETELDEGKFYLFDNEKDARDYAKKIKGKYVKGTGKSAGQHAVVKEEVELDEAMKYTHAVVDPEGKVAGMSTSEREAKDIASRHKGKVVKLKKPMATKKGDMMINRPLKEGTWALPDSPKSKAALKKLMSKPIKLGKEGDNAADLMYSLIGDDELFDDLYVAGKKNPNGDARDVIKKAMKRLGIKEEDEKKPDKPDSAKAVDQARDDKKKTRIAQLQLQIAKASEMINKLNSQEKPDA